MTTPSGPSPWARPEAEHGAGRPRRRRAYALAVAWLLLAVSLSACLQRGDAMPPTVSIREPRSGATSATANLRIIGYAFDDEGIRALRLNGVDQLATPGYASERGKRLVEFAFTIDALTDGDVTVMIEAEDMRGRVTTYPYRLLLDSTPPTLELSAVTPLAGGRVRVEGVVRDNSLVTAVLINGVPLAFSPAPEHTFRVEVAQLQGGGVEVVVEDAAGNVTQRTSP